MQIDIFWAFVIFNIVLPVAFMLVLLVVAIRQGRLRTWHKAALLLALAALIPIGMNRLRANVAPAPPDGAIAACAALLGEPPLRITAYPNPAGYRITGWLEDSVRREHFQCDVRRDTAGWHATPVDPYFSYLESVQLPPRR